MLVLALQFSKGGRRGRTSDMFVERGTPLAAGASSMPSPEGHDRMVGSLKTEEKTKFVEPACQEERILRLTCRFDVPTNAPTGSGSNRVGRMPTND